MAALVLTRDTCPVNQLIRFLLTMGGRARAVARITVVAEQRTTTVELRYATSEVRLLASVLAAARRTTMMVRAGMVSMMAAGRCSASQTLWIGRIARTLAPLLDFELNHYRQEFE